MRRYLNVMQAYLFFSVQRSLRRQFGHGKAVPRVENTRWGRQNSRPHGQSCCRPRGQGRKPEGHLSLHPRSHDARHQFSRDNVRRRWGIHMSCFHWWYSFHWQLWWALRGNGERYGEIPGGNSGRIAWWNCKLTPMLPSKYLFYTDDVSILKRPFPTYSWCSVAMNTVTKASFLPQILSKKILKSRSGFRRSRTRGKTKNQRFLRPSVRYRI